MVFADKPISRKQRLRGMLLEAYRYAISLGSPSVKKIIETASGGSGDSGGRGKPEKSSSSILKRVLELKLTPTDVVYEFGKDGDVSFWVGGFLDKEDVKMAREERLELKNRKSFDREEQEDRVRALNSKNHLKPELNYD